MKKELDYFWIGNTYGGNQDWFPDFMMKPYLRPRWSGVDTLDIYIDGFQKYLSEHQCKTICMTPFYGDRTVSEAEKALKKQIDSELPVPCLILNHKSRALKDYEWHWFLLNGYELFEDKCLVKAVTYGSWQWLDFEELWNTGYQRKGGLVLYVPQNVS